MEIVYDESGTRVMLRKDDGTEVDLLKLEGALTLAQNSREFNRKRVVVLEDKLERIAAILAEGRGADTSLSDRLYTAAEVGDLQASEAELVAAPLRAENQRLARQVCEFDRDRRTERDRADRVTRERDARPTELDWAAVRRERDDLKGVVARRERRIGELERQLALSIERENKLEADAAEEKILHKGSLDARDSLLRAATTRVQAAREILSASPVDHARDEIVTSKGAVLADAIGNALRALGS